MTHDYSLDEIGKRLRGEGLTPEEQILAEDDKVRVLWAREQLKDAYVIYDIGSSDGSVTAGLRASIFALDKHPAHTLSNRWFFHGEAADGLLALRVWDDSAWICVAWCGEIFEHLTLIEGKRILDALPASCQHLVVTVPNRNSASYDASGRSRWDWPDHKRHFTHNHLREWLSSCGWRHERIEPIVGTLEDSIWLGAVARRV